MVADVMTKALGVVKFTQFRTAMKVLPLLGEDSQTAASTAAAPAAAAVRRNYLNYIYACEGQGQG
ncbi:hypothetical protein PF010_g3483 [Phytophthora fragariae]|nr:hypothetical protein PF003_g1916 [Phytophthora fragariae]KAE8945975.1 hypothetical protein PF009_g4398 [Phytophthora fragariae]KAE9131418.1 hypothetical protein PF010_g3483 [Phytophthora fragariae]KAE9131499.1 hypothetical protein PF007_g4127 [Phytophthora fragariae]KAE9249321.1 hypothetical protein PF004_g3460 [Phytophthora fragariae]